MTLQIGLVHIPALCAGLLCSKIPKAEQLNHTFNIACMAGVMCIALVPALHAGYIERCVEHDGMSDNTRCFIMLLNILLSQPIRYCMEDAYQQTAPVSADHAYVQNGARILS